MLKSMHFFVSYIDSHCYFWRLFTPEFLSPGSLHIVNNDNVTFNPHIQTNVNYWNIIELELFCILHHPVRVFFFFWMANMHYPLRVLVSLDLSLEQFSLHVQIGGEWWHNLFASQCTHTVKIRKLQLVASQMQW